MGMDDKIKGAHLRGKKYTVSQDGLCPRCGNSNRLYVILDKYVLINPIFSLLLLIGEIRVFVTNFLSQVLPYF